MQRRPLKILQALEATGGQPGVIPWAWSMGHGMLLLLLLLLLVPHLPLFPPLVVMCLPFTRHGLVLRCSRPGDLRRIKLRSTGCNNLRSTTTELRRRCGRWSIHHCRATSTPAGMEKSEDMSSLLSRTRSAHLQDFP